MWVLKKILIYFIEVLIPCTIGTVIEHQHDRLLDELCAFPWYELSLKEQKIFLQLIHKCQYLNSLELPLVGDVNFELLKDILNAAYSYCMYILNFVQI